MEVAKVQVVREPPTSGLAGQLLKRYYTELAVRFPDGFDPELAGRVPVEDLVPPNGTFLVVRVNDLPVGCGAMRKLNEATAELKRMWVDPSIRGCGVGFRLLSALEEAAAQLGCRTVRLDSSPYLPEALGLYRSSGYREIPAYNDNVYAGHWFEKHLS
jgi:GNAT superfamily N-acetyltransferase